MTLTAVKSPDLDCTTCGACCLEAGPVPVYPDENVPQYLTQSVRGRMGFIREDAENGIRQMDKHLGGRCKALKGVIGAACKCGIYEKRPRVCRTFPVGSPGCLQARFHMIDKMKYPERRYRGYGVNWKDTVK